MILSVAKRLFQDPLRRPEAERGKAGRRVDLTESIVEEAQRSIRTAVAGRSPDGVLKQPLTTDSHQRVPVVRLLGIVE